MSSASYHGNGPSPTPNYNSGGGGGGSSAQPNERRIDVTRSNYSVIDNEFDSMRERFENEMHRVENEMQRLRKEFDGYRPVGSSGGSTAGGGGGVGGAPPSRPYSSASSTNDRYYGGSQAPATNSLMTSRPLYDPYIDNLKSPLIKDESDLKTLRLRFDVAQYKPEEVTVKTVDNRLLVHAKHEEKTPSRTVFREYNQEFMLPRGTNPEQISSTLSSDGVLTVEAPLPQMAIKN